MSSRSTAERRTTFLGVEIGVWDPQRVPSAPAPVPVGVTRLSGRGCHRRGEERQRYPVPCALGVKFGGGGFSHLQPFPSPSLCSLSRCCASAPGSGSRP